MDSQGILLLIRIGLCRLISFVCEDLTTKHCYFGCSRLPNVDGIKIFDKDDQATKHYNKENNVLQPGHLDQKVQSYHCQEALNP